MASNYDIQVSTLRTKLRAKNISFGKVIKLINEGNADELNKILYNDDIVYAINDIMPIRDAINAADNRLDNLKILLKNKNISFKKVFKCIKSGDSYRLFILLNNDDIMALINNIYIEIQNIKATIKEKFNDLTWINNTLIYFKKEPQPTKTKALKKLKTIHINIYDLIYGCFERRTTLDKLRNDLLKNPHRCFPKKEAKGSNLKYYLRTGYTKKIENMDPLRSPLSEGVC